MDLLEFVMDLHSLYYSVLKNMIPFTIGLDKKKVILDMFSLVIMQELKLIHMILCL